MYTLDLKCRIHAMQGTRKSTLLGNVTYDLASLSAHQPMEEGGK